MEPNIHAVGHLLNSLTQHETSDVGLPLSNVITQANGDTAHLGLMPDNSVDYVGTPDPLRALLVLPDQHHGSMVHPTMHEIIRGGSANEHAGSATSSLKLCALQSQTYALLSEVWCWTTMKMEHITTFSEAHPMTEGVRTSLCPDTEGPQGQLIITDV
jgi:hypothetical protein